MCLTIGSNPESQMADVTDNVMSVDASNVAQNNTTGTKKPPDDDSLDLKAAEKVVVRADKFSNIQSDRENVQALELDNGRFLFYISSVDMVDEIVSQSKKGNPDASASSTDLVPNVYEGGFKVWESSVDLVHYLSSLDIAWRGLKVAEIGCGSGLPGLYTFTQGADVTFTDYNKEVLENVTIPNVVLNLEENDTDKDTISSRCQFWAGDWSFVQEKLDLKFDIILTSETIYNPDNYTKLYNIVRKLLKDSGKVYIAAKTYYFGVGGGTRDFENLVKKLGEFSVEVVKVYEEGVQREILLMEWLQR